MVIIESAVSGSSPFSIAVWRLSQKLSWSFPLDGGERDD